LENARITARSMYFQGAAPILSNIRDLDFILLIIDIQLVMIVYRSLCRLSCKSHAKILNRVKVVEFSPPKNHRMLIL
jgi:hypothetical protein